MKLAKKLLSIVSSLAIVSSLMAFAVPAHAEGLPVITPTLVETDVEGVYDLAIGLDTTACEPTAGGTRVLAISVKVSLDDAIFDMENGPAHQVWNEDDEVWIYDNITFGKSNWTNQATKSYSNDIFTLAWNTGTSTGQANSSPSTFATLKGLKIKDGVETSDISIPLTAVVSVGTTTSNFIKYTTPDGTGTPFTITPATFPGNKTDDSGDDDDTNAPVKVGGVIEDTVGDSKDAAVAYTQKFTAVEGYKVRWNLTCNKVGEPDKMINGSYTYTIANIETEGDVNIGLIVQYDPSVYENVVVTDGAIVTE